MSDLPLDYDTVLDFSNNGPSIGRFQYLHVAMV